MSQQSMAAATKSNWTLGCSHRGIAGSNWDVIIPLRIGQVASELLCPILVTTFQEREADWRGFKWRLQRWSKGWKPAPWGKAEGVRSSIKVFQYLEGRHKEERSSFFTRRHMEKTRTMCTSCIISSWYEKGNFYSENNNSVEQPYQENGPHHRRFWIWDQSGC